MRTRPDIDAIVDYILLLEDVAREAELLMEAEPKVHPDNRFDVMGLTAALDQLPPLRNMTSSDHKSEAEGRASESVNVNTDLLWSALSGDVATGSALARIAALEDKVLSLQMAVSVLLVQFKKGPQRSTTRNESESIHPQNTEA